MMNKLIALALIFTIHSAKQSFASNTPESNLYLTSYSINKDGVVIANIRLMYGKIKSVSIEGQQAAFSIKKNIQLALVYK